MVKGGRDKLTLNGIPFNQPFVSQASTQGLNRVLASKHLKGDGAASQRCAKYISGLTGGGLVLLTPSCTASLEMSSLLARIEPGDEVIVPSFTFTSAALAIVNFGGVPVFVDIDPISKNIDVTKIRESITPRTKAISVVNYAGVACEYGQIKSICQEFGLFLIEDNAHGLGGKYFDKPLGSFGNVATQSFHETKNIQCGEGGAIIVNEIGLNDDSLVLREKGTDRSLFERGEVRKYQWIGKGSSFLMSEILAGFLEGQLEEFNFIQDERKRVWNFYSKNLEKWAGTKSIELMTVPENCEQTFHMFYMVTPNTEIRKILIDELDKNGIKAVFHYQSLHKSIGGKKYSFGTPELPISDHMSENLLRLPLYPELTNEQLEIICSTIEKIKL